jgi:hypothetical protein
VDDEAGAIEFCQRVRPRLVGTLSLLCGSAGVAEELAQEALAPTWSNWPRSVSWENLRPLPGSIALL